MSFKFECLTNNLCEPAHTWLTCCSVDKIHLLLEAKKRKSQRTDQTRNQRWRKREEEEKSNLIIIISIIIINFTITIITAPKPCKIIAPLLIFVVTPSLSNFAPVLTNKQTKYTQKQSLSQNSTYNLIHMSPVRSAQKLCTYVALHSLLQPPSGWHKFTCVVVRVTALYCRSVACDLLVVRACLIIHLYDE